MGRSSDEILDHAEQTVFEIAEQESRGRKNYAPIKDLLVAALDRVDELFHKKSAITGVATGFSDFDDRTAGLQPSDLIIVAGRPSMGKTAFAVNIAEHAAIKDKMSVAVFSMEMPGEQLAMRMMSSLGRIDQHKVRTGKLRDEDWPRLTSAVEIMKDAKLFVDDTPALTPAELRARCRRLAREYGLDLIIVDYLQLMQVPGTKENRATEISEISRSLKAMAKELRVPVVALSQLNRSLEQRPNKRPVMSDLRESGAIEQDADVIVFIYRDEVYDEDSADKGIAEIIIGKQRNGPIGTVKLAFLGQYTRFENYTEEQPPYLPGPFE
jgi:replicative DNA helicase